MPKERIIMHVDMDYFYAAVEEREQPELKGKPVVVGADPKGGKGRGVVSTANYEARSFGIHSGQPISIAWRKCPECVFLPVRMELYVSVSEKIMKILRKYADKFEQTSIDEAYLDVSSVGSYSKAEELAKKIKKEILEKEKLSCSIGIGPNKLIAKIASDSKKPDGLTVVQPSRVLEFIDDMDVDVLYGVGPKTRAILHQLGYKTVKQLRKAPLEVLVELFGVFGKVLYLMARGIDEREIVEFYPIKSIGKQLTFEKNTNDKKVLLPALEQIVDEVHQQLVELGFLCRTITVKVRYAWFETHTASRTLDKATESKALIKATALKLLEPFLQGNELIRLIGVSLSNLVQKKQLGG
ncbi:MAG: DNA polymerase IV [Candidatus Woesearchaeota archaeon]